MSQYQIRIPESNIVIVAMKYLYCLKIVEILRRLSLFDIYI